MRLEPLKKVEILSTPFRMRGSCAADLLEESMSEAAHSQNATFSRKFFASTPPQKADDLFSCSQGLFLVAAIEVSVAKWYSVGLLTEVGGSIPSRNTFFMDKNPFIFLPSIQERSLTPIIVAIA